MLNLFAISRVAKTYNTSIEPGGELGVILYINKLDSQDEEACHGVVYSETRPLHCF